MESKCEKDVPLKLWLISFNVGTSGCGCAIIKADSPFRAEAVLRHSGMMSVNKALYRVKTVVEIKDGITEGILAEEVLP